MRDVRAKYIVCVKNGLGAWGLGVGQERDSERLFQGAPLDLWAHAPTPAPLPLQMNRMRGMKEADLGVVLLSVHPVDALTLELRGFAMNSGPSPRPQAPGPLSRMDIEISSASPADTPVILSLIRELAEFERLLDQVTATEEELREHLFVRRAAEVVLARKDGEVVGFALFFHSFSTFLGKPGIYLEDLYVRPKYRGFGCGAALLRHLARLAVERKCGRLEWSVLDWNQRAIDFYKSLGAEPLDEWTMYRVTGEALRRLAQCKV